MLEQYGSSAGSDGQVRSKPRGQRKLSRDLLGEGCGPDRPSDQVLSIETCHEKKYSRKGSKVSMIGLDY